MENIWDVNNSDLEINELDKIDIMNRVSDDVIMENIDEQLEKEVLMQLHPTNYLQLFNERFNIVIDKFDEDHELKKKLTNIKVELYSKVLETIQDKFKIYADFNFELLSYRNYFYNIEKLYEFFILNYRENLETFLLGYIFDNKRSYVDHYKPITDKKDKTVSSLRRKFLNLSDVVIVFNIAEIVEDIVNNFESGDVIIETIVNTDRYESLNISISDLFLEESEITCYTNEGFCKEYLSPLDKEEFSYKILNNLRLLMMSKFPHKN